MNKFFKRIAASVASVALSIPIALSAAACNVSGGGDGGGGNNNHTHSYSYVQNTDGKTHTGTCNATGGTCDEKTVTGNCVDTNPKDGKCDICKGAVTTVNPENPEPPEPTPPTPTVQHTVTFYLNDGTDATNPQTVDEGSAAPTYTPKRSGNYAFGGWYRDKDCSEGQRYNGEPVNADLKLYAKWTAVSAQIVDNGAYNESLYVVWKEGNPTDAEVKVEYAKAGQSDFVTVPAQLIRAVSSTEARVDILGLAAGDYDVKITSSDGETLEVPSLTVNEYDRSGYAHFKYEDGVGAYNDDGTLKDGALVIYVTDQNKNDVTGSVYKYKASDNTYTEEDISQYITITDSVDSFNEQAVSSGAQKGIGEILNNRRYAGNHRMNIGIAKLCDVYGAVAVRIVGKVTSGIKNNDYTTGEPIISGLTYYAKKETKNPITDQTYGKTENESPTNKITGRVPNGGSVGDNGNMARMVNAHDLTIEGVGEDSVIEGWGLHFISSNITGKDAKDGTSFEVRNITFDKCPEDAVGMEGEQEDSSSTITSSVERCWVHNNTFLPGYCPEPAESDKAEGDGSCDFKRGQYLTVSYNYFEYCHKTNLVGSSDSSLQFNLTYHHNWWYNCSSRIPLARHANIHFYNNYVLGDMTAAKKPDLSYVHSIRADTYIFSEANYYDGVKNLTEFKQGAIKGYNNTLFSEFGDNVMKSYARDAKLPNACKYKTTDYSSFDTDEELFYYKNGVSDCKIESSTQARKTVILNAGANGHGKDKETRMFTQVPDGAVTPDEDGVSVTFPTAITGVILNDVNNQGKFRGVGIIFKLSTETEVTVTSGETGDLAPDIVDIDGKVWAHKITKTLNISLPAGVYAICSGQKEKECTVSALSFSDTAASSAQRIQAAVDAISAIPASVTLADKDTVAAARAAYDALKTDEKTTFGSQHGDLVTKLTAAEAEINKLLAENVDRLIGLIGSVNAESYEKIHAAREAYEALPEAAKDLVKNLSTLEAAETEFAGIAVKSINDKITAFLTKTNGDLDTASKETLNGYKTEAELIESLYESLTPEQQGQVEKYSDLQTAVDKVKQALCWYDFLEKLAYFDNHTVTAEDGDKVAELKAAYNALSAAQQQKAESSEKTKYDKVLSDYDKVKPKIVETYFDGGVADSGDGVIRAKGGEKDTSITINGASHKGMKFESTNGVLLITVSSDATLTLYVDAAQKFLYCDAYTGTDLTHPGKNTSGENKFQSAETANSYGLYEITIQLTAGTYRILKGDSMNLYYAKVQYK